LLLEDGTTVLSTTEKKRKYSLFCYDIHHTHIRARTYVHMYVHVCVYVYEMYQNMNRNRHTFFLSSLNERLRTTWRMGHSSIILPEYPRMLRARERCSITGRGREAIDVSSDDNVTTPGLV
jgi:hypothetical protein